MTPPPRIKYTPPDRNQLQLPALDGSTEPPERMALTLWLERDLIVEFVKKAVKPQSGDVVVAVEGLMRKAIAESH